MDHCIVTELKENRVMSIVGIETNLVHVEAPWTKHAELEKKRKTIIYLI